LVSTSFAIHECKSPKPNQTLCELFMNELKHKPTSDQLRAWGKLGGVAKSLLKVKASRANGKLGGRHAKLNKLRDQRFALAGKVRTPDEEAELQRLTKAIHEFCRPSGINPVIGASKRKEIV